MPRDCAQMRTVSSCLQALSIILVSQGIRTNPIAAPGIVMPPRWARDPIRNPCALLGWQLVLWPPDNRCYQVFRRGPCMESLELAVDTNGNPYCRCPPGQLRAPDVSNSTCYNAHHRGPCPHNHYLQPIAVHSDIGKCVTAVSICTPEKPLLWAPSGQCYKLKQPPARGPCSWGELLLQDPDNTALAHCGCDHKTLGYHETTRSCHQLFTRGPCIKGHILLPNGTCGCHKGLKEYYAPKQACYALGERGPCEYGENLVYQSPGHSAVCQCASDRMQVRGIKRGCWRALTRGPCLHGFIVLKSRGGVGSCEPEPCPQGLLLHLGTRMCHPPGTEHPCPRGQKLLFAEADSGDVSILGQCGCPTNKGCTDKDSVMLQTSVLNEVERAGVHTNRTGKMYINNEMEKRVQNLQKNNTNSTDITENYNGKIYQRHYRHHHHNHRYQPESTISSQNISINKTQESATVTQNKSSFHHEGLTNIHVSQGAATNTQFDTAQILDDIRKQIVLMEEKTPILASVSHKQAENNYDTEQILSDIQRHFSKPADRSTDYIQ